MRKADDRFDPFISPSNDQLYPAIGTSDYPDNRFLYHLDLFDSVFVYLFYTKVPFKAPKLSNQGVAGSTIRF
jgi:hypothetical protein